ncbi:dynein regulatory complex protein 8-like [Asterias amurensis]|uniref:dynein regulatory complex protein 8-like n=1 Tax=Asterias amurensis TaxID=7602 RepID=UPI003AB6167B
MLDPGVTGERYRYAALLMVARLVATLWRCKQSFNMAAPADEKESAESLLAETQKKIADAFDIFDHESNKTVDVREVGTIIRSLNCCPSEGELHDLLAEMEEEEPTGYIRFDRFLKTMTGVLMERKFKASPEDQLQKAFEVLDMDKKGHLTVEELTKYMTEEAEPFTQEELEEMLSAAVDPDKGVILYKDYASLMAVDETA